MPELYSGKKNFFCRLVKTRDYTSEKNFTLMKFVILIIVVII